MDQWLINFLSRRISYEKLMCQTLTAELVYLFAAGMIEQLGQTMQLLVVTSRDQGLAVQREGMAFLREIRQAAKRFGIDIDRRMVSLPSCSSAAT